MNAIHTLVIACGNPLRGDDGLGPRAADIVASWQMPGVEVLTVHQLVPELIEDMKHAQRVLFVDAGVPLRAGSVSDGPFHTHRLESRPSRQYLGHHLTPANLLAFMCELEGQAPPAWVVSIAALSFEYSEELTEEAHKNLEAALVWIRDFLAGHD